MTKSGSTKGGATPGGKAGRKDRLATALRANLKRRKAGIGQADGGAVDLADEAGRGAENAVEDTPDDAIEDTGRGDR